MNRPISDVGGTIQLEGLWDVEVRRADGTVERKTLKNTVTANGMNRIANRSVHGLTATSGMNYVVVGTATSAPADTDGQSAVGEVSRKISALNVQSREWCALVATWAGNTDGLTGVALDSAAISDYQSSHASTGIIFNRVNGLGVTLQASDFLNLTVRIRVGSHNQAHTT